MRAVADRLGMDPDALKKALDGGSTMSSLAAQLAQFQNRGALVDGYV